MLKKRAELNAIQLQQAASNFWYVVKTCLKNCLDLLFFFFLSEGHPTGMLYVDFLRGHPSSPLLKCLC